MIAALIMAHITAIVRRWLVFFGLARPRANEPSDTLFSRISAWLRRPRVRRYVVAALALELTVGGAWVGIAHGEHLFRVADQTVGALRGERIRYVGVCDLSGEDRMVRVAIDSSGTVTVRRI